MGLVRLEWATSREMQVSFDLPHPRGSPIRYVELAYVFWNMLEDEEQSPAHVYKNGARVIIAGVDDISKFDRMTEYDEAPPFETRYTLGGDAAAAAASGGSLLEPRQGFSPGTACRVVARTFNGVGAGPWSECPAEPFVTRPEIPWVPSVP